MLRLIQIYDNFTLNRMYINIAHIWYLLKIHIVWDSVYLLYKHGSAWRNSFNIVWSKRELEANMFNSSDSKYNLIVSNYLGIEVFGSGSFNETIVYDTRL